ncbi:uncharacterized protein Z518_00706 [Rhinocladiella mackenziei CBS 650.93]|uniref:Velvet domain-containing protein n=1 Tax=Rhinocladiella mackenziei CBS 650.93 TaxID=1442369 RepID=A0A0D2JJL5_9EURO|nr:uncharacterized protein Z518_00706 [Rhinocladiella mackenziei CBS 650.93]KIX09625.1 hypothetical protein Z518_00706 [Rhinocladiella mackenziei CBS 650.93]
MELAIAPPSRVAAGVAFHTPLVVTFSSPKPTTDGKEENRETVVLPDMSGVWAFVSLTTPDMQQSLAPPRADLLRGKTADSIHPIHQEQEGERSTIAYATFPGLKITQPGQYRIKVNIIDMNASPTENAGEGAGLVLPSLHSQIFDVVEGSEHGIYGPEVAETLSLLRSIGVDC